MVLQGAMIGTPSNEGAAGGGEVSAGEVVAPVTLLVQVPAVFHSRCGQLVTLTQVRCGMVGYGMVWCGTVW